MKNSETVLSVKFKSSFPAEKLMQVCEQNLESFRAVPGLIQKYYLAEEGTGFLSGFYTFETKADREKFWASDLAKDIPARYGVIPESLRVESYDMAIVLNDAVPA